MQKLIQEPEQSESANNLEEVIIHLYMNTTDKAIKKQLLSLISLSHTKRELQELIPGVTVNAINEARKHASEIGEGAQVPKKKAVFRQKMDIVKLDHALDFFFNPAFHQVSSVGTKEMKLEDGCLVTIPEVVRTVWHSTPVKIYLAYCEETDFVPLSRSTLFHILSVCPASKQTNLKGLDNVAAEGGNSFDVLLSTIADLEKYTTNARQLMELKECKESLVSSRIYMKTDFKVHLKQANHCADHCLNFALSDPSDRNLQQVCSDHQHDIVCDRCELLPESVLNLKEIVGKLDIAPNIRDDMLADIDAADAKIIEWKSHIVRSINQDQARIQILKNLQPGDVLLIMDWAMKFLPISYRERQMDWFGQKGVNWHTTVCIYKDEQSNLKNRTFVHMMDGIKQDWMTVACLLEQTLLEIKRQLPNTTRAFLRSDNAGCYHCGNLLLAIPGISNRTGVLIARYDFSEAQNGKSYCDAKIAHMRGKLRKVAASGHDIITAIDMKLAIDMHGGTAGCQAAHVVISCGGVPPTFNKCPIKGVTKISNVEFDKNSIKTWRAFGVGVGSQLPTFHEIKDLSKVEVLSDFILPSGLEGNIKEPESDTSIEEKTFICPEEGCIKSFCKTLMCRILLSRKP